MSKTKISWTEHTWNPIIGCSKVSPGCDNCYAESMAIRISNMSHGVGARYRKAIAGGIDRTAKWSGRTVFDGDILQKPLKRTKPTMYFVCSMSDLFHENTPLSWIDEVFITMRKCPHHTFQVITKRPERMLEYLMKRPSFDWPLPNVWLGVTAENQEQADKRVPILLECPAAVRFVSVEPMLGPVDLQQSCTKACPNGDCWLDGPTGHRVTTDPEEGGLAAECFCSRLNKLDWVICGCESGPGRRLMDLNWVRDLRDQCHCSCVPFFMKQMEIDGKVCKEMKEFPMELWIREWPEVRS